MEYWDFLEKVKAEILEYLPEKFADADVGIKPVVKNNDMVLDG